MSWNYRIVKHAEVDGDSYGLHEVFYDDDGPTSMTETPTTLIGDTPQEVIEALQNALGDAVNLPIFEQPPHWKSADDTKPKEPDMTIDDGIDWDKHYPPNAPEMKENADNCPICGVPLETKSPGATPS